MEGLAPPLKCLLEIETRLQNGESVRTGIQKYLEQDIDAFTEDVRKLFFAYEQGRTASEVINSVKSVYRVALLEVLLQGLEGQPILNRIQELKIKIMDASESEIKEVLALLPLKLLVPLLLFQFPAFLLMLFGPIMRHLIGELGK